MRDYLEIVVDNETKCRIELPEDAFTEENDSIFENASSGSRIIRKAKSFFDSSFDQIKFFSDSIAKSVKASSACPDEFELEFAVKFGADAGVVISSISSEANITIRMKWIKEKG